MVRTMTPTSATLVSQEWMPKARRSAPSSPQLASHTAVVRTRRSVRNLTSVAAALGAVALVRSRIR